MLLYPLQATIYFTTGNTYGPGSHAPNFLPFFCHQETSFSEIGPADEFQSHFSGDHKHLKKNKYVTLETKYYCLLLYSALQIIALGRGCDKEVKILDGGRAFDLYDCGASSICLGEMSLQGTTVLYNKPLTL